jgi:aspartyl-tRNA(Asn)/glutamyl-tRNA(Gln) amidotransferase subunit B
VLRFSVSTVETPRKISVFPVIGLEVHAQLQTRSKIFCACPVTVGAPPNSATCPVCLGFPGTLPVLNRQAVTLALRLATATGATIHRESQFARKNYFYRTCQGLQISQYDQPFSWAGDHDRHASGEKQYASSGPHREDAGKLLPTCPPRVPKDVSLVTGTGRACR